MASPNQRPFPAEEPRAEIRTFAGAMREMYVALQQEGFTAPEAMQVVGITIASSMGSGGR